MVCSPTEVCTLSLEYPLLQAHAADVAVASAARAEEPTTLLCPSFPVHSTRLALLRSTYVLRFDASSFYERVMACLLRYKAVFHPNGGRRHSLAASLGFGQTGAYLLLLLSIMNL